MKLAHYIPPDISTYDEAEINIRKQFVEEYMRDGDARSALIRMGQPPQLLDRLEVMYMTDYVVAVMLQEAKENFHNDLLNANPKVLARVASILYQDACTAPKASDRISASGKLLDILQIEKMKSSVVGTKERLTLESLKQELTKRGYGEITLDDKFSRRAD